MNFSIVKTGDQQTNFPPPSRAAASFMPGTRAPKPLNVVAAWIGMKASELEKPSAPRASASVRTPGVTLELTCEGVRLAALSGESDRHRARPKTFDKRKPSLVARSYLLSAAN
jgi:hypothetical protein